MNLTYQSSSVYRLSIQCSPKCHKEKSVFKMLRNTITWQFQVGLTSANTQGNSPTSLPDMVLWQEQHRAVMRSWEACHVLICIRTLNIPCAKDVFESTY